MVRTASVAGITTLAMALASVGLAGCSGHDTVPSAVATRIHQGPSGAGEREPGRGGLIASATWTLPPPAGGPVAGAGGNELDAAPPTGSAQPASGAPSSGGAQGPGGTGSASGGIPRATPHADVPVPSGGPPLTDPHILALMDEVQGSRLASDAAALADAVRRDSRERSDGETGVESSASAWLSARSEAIADSATAQVQVELEDFPLTGGGSRATGRSVLSTIAGIGLRKRVIYAIAPYSGHGARDGDADASERAAAELLEAARVLSRRQWDATIRLAAFDGSGAGGQGSAHHASRAADVGLPIDAVVHIGATAADVPVSGDAEVAAGDGADAASRQLARYAAAIGERYGVPPAPVGAVGSRAPSPDARAFGAQGFPVASLAVVPEAGGRAGPTVERTAPDSRRLESATRLAIATIANLALAPTAPSQPPRVHAVEDGASVRVAWDPVDDPSVDGYWLAVRSPDEPNYRPLIWAGTATEAILQLGSSGERLVFAVAASDDLGHLSRFSPEAAN